jgi:hypothetical protein
MQAKPMQSVDQLLFCPRLISFLVGVFNSKYERSTQATRKQEGIER